MGRESSLRSASRNVSSTRTAAPDADGDAEDAGQFWTDFIAETAPEFRKSTTEQLTTFIQPTYQALIDGAMYAEPALRTIVEVRPDVLVEDNVVLPGTRDQRCAVRADRVVQPAEIPGAGIPPDFSGLPMDAPDTGPAFRSEFERTHRQMWEAFNAWVQEQGAAPLPDLEFARDNAANIYVYPEEDYTDARPLGDSWHRIDSSVRSPTRTTSYLLPSPTVPTTVRSSTSPRVRSAVPTSS